MVDDKTDRVPPNIQNPIFETVPQEAPSKSENEAVPVVSPEEIDDNISSIEEPPPIYEENKGKYIFIGLGVVFFMVVFFLILRMLGVLGKKPPQKISLLYWGLWEEKEIFAPLISDYQRKNPFIQINYIKMEPRDYRIKLLERSKNGQGPDIFRFHNTWLPALKEVVAPLPKNIINDQEFNKTFYPVVQQDLKVGSSYYGIPLEIDGLVLVYNDNLFKRAGIETVPKTWEDVINDAVKLSVKDKDKKIITSGIALGVASNVEHFSDILGWMILQNGGNLKTINGVEGVDALEAYRKFAEAPANVWDEQMSNSIASFIQGRVAMIIVPSWEILTIKQNNPDISLKVTALPIVPGADPVSLATYWVEGVSRYSKNQLEAWKFLRFLVEKENLVKLYGEASKTRLFGEPYSRVDLSSILVQNEYVGSVIQQAQNMKSLSLISKTYDDGLNDSIIKYLEDAVNATIKGVSYKEALDTAKRGVDQAFEKYGL